MYVLTLIDGETSEQIRTINFPTKEEALEFSRSPEIWYLGLNVEIKKIAEKT